MAPATKKKADPDVPTTVQEFEFTAPGRDLIGQLNLTVPSELGAARQAVQSAFNAIYDPGSNSPTTVKLSVDSDSITVTVTQSEYVHGG